MKFILTVQNDKGETIEKRVPLENVQALKNYVEYVEDCNAAKTAYNTIKNICTKYSDNCSHCPFGKERAECLFYESAFCETEDSYISLSNFIIPQSWEDME